MQYFYSALKDDNNTESFLELLDKGITNNTRILTFELFNEGVSSMRYLNKNFLYLSISDNKSFVFVKDPNMHDD